MCIISRAGAQMLSAANPAPADTIHGIALVLGAGGTMNLDTATNQLRYTQYEDGIVFPVHCYEVRTYIELVATLPARRAVLNDGNTYSYNSRYFREADWVEITDWVYDFKPGFDRSHK